METASASVWTKTKFRIRETALFLPGFLKRPVTGIHRVPDWDVWNALLLFAMVSIPSGILAGLIQRSFMGILWGIFLLPIVALFFIGGLSSIFYYSFSTLFKTPVDPNRVFLVVILASIPVLVMRIFVSLFPPLSLLAVAASGALLVVGFVENFQLPRAKIIKLVSALFAVFLVYWIVQTIRASRLEKPDHRTIPAESLQKLQDEFNDAVK
jgi:hypothetical protein